MTKDIKDYLHIHLGCQICTGTGNVTLIAVQKETASTVFRVIVLNGNQIHEIEWNNDCRLALRPLSDMTEEEARVILPDMPTENKLIEWGYYNEYSEGNVFYQYLKKAEDERLISILEDSLGVPEHWLSLLSKGFDLFGLIDAGLAIDKTKI